MQTRHKQDATKSYQLQQLRSQSTEHILCARRRLQIVRRIHRQRIVIAIIMNFTMWPSTSKRLKSLPELK